MFSNLSSVCQTEMLRDIESQADNRRKEEEEQREERHKNIHKHAVVEESNCRAAMSLQFHWLRTFILRDPDLS